MQDRALSPRLVALFAIVAGATVANIYYAQPLLDGLATDFRISTASAGLLVTASQVGFLIGLALLVPLGDLLERRGLLTITLLAAAAAAAGCAAAPGFGALAVALVVLGVTSVVAQIVVPLSSSLAAPAQRGQVVGTVMSGLLVGILLARTLSGAIAQVGGWRLVFAISTLVMLLAAAAIRRALPLCPPPHPQRYRAALRSVARLVAEEAVLRRRMALGALGFAGFSTLWTSIAFLLAGPPFHYSEGLIGLFGLAGAAGALMAPISGRLADRGHGTLALRALLACVLAAWGLLDLGGSSVLPLIAGIVLLDLGVQGVHVSNQTAIYRLRPEARSRLTTAYMVSVFLGGVVGSVLSAVSFEAYGWGGTCALGAAFAATAIAVALAFRVVDAPEPAVGAPGTAVAADG